MILLFTINYFLCFFVAENLLVYPPKHVIYGDYVFEFWDEEMIRKILGFFTPKNMRVDVVSKFFKSQGTMFCSVLFSRHIIVVVVVVVIIIRLSMFLVIRVRKLFNLKL